MAIPDPDSRLIADSRLERLDHLQEYIFNTTTSRVVDGFNKLEREWTDMPDILASTDEALVLLNVINYCKIKNHRNQYGR